MGMALPKAPEADGVIWRKTPRCDSGLRSQGEGLWCSPITHGGGTRKRQDLGSPAMGIVGTPQGERAI